MTSTLGGSASGVLGDITSLEVINQTGVVRCVKARAESGNAYTFCGSDILLAVGAIGSGDVQSKEELRALHEAHVAGAGGPHASGGGTQLFADDRPPSHADPDGRRRRGRDDRDRFAGRAS